MSAKHSSACSFVAFQNSHGVKQRSLAFKAVRCTLANQIEELVKRGTENKCLKNLPNISNAALFRPRMSTYRIHIAHVASIHKTTRLDKSNLAIVARLECAEDVNKGVAFWRREAIGGRCTICYCWRRGTGRIFRSYQVSPRLWRSCLGRRRRRSRSPLRHGRCRGLCCRALILLL